MSRNRLVILLAAFLLIPAAAHAQSTTITACYVPNTGSVYRIKAAGVPDACKKGHVEFSWESAGTTFTPRFAPPVVITPNSFEQSFAACQAGETMVSGGYSIFPNLTVSVAVNAPVTSGQHANSWFVDMRNLSSVDVTMTAYVMCAKPAS